jgi:putative ABC transport system permease protein
MGVDLAIEAGTKYLSGHSDLLLGMIFVQVLVVGLLGFGIGAGMAAVTGSLLKPAGVGFFMPWQLLAGACVSMLLICLVGGALSAIRVMRLEPAIVFKA